MTSYRKSRDFNYFTKRTKKLENEKKTTWKNNIYLLKKNNTNESRSVGILLSTITFLIVGGVLLLSYFLLNKPILTVIEASYYKEKTFISYFQWRYQAPLF